jgi:hypothetical protein
MALDLQSAKVNELTAMIDFKPVPKEQEEAKVIWATVQIYYDFVGLTPDISIHVPVQWRQGTSSSSIKAEALRSARDLLDHACSAPEIATTPQAMPKCGFQTAA